MARTLKPNVNDRRPAETERGPPVAMNGFIEEGPPAARARLVYSLGERREKKGQSEIHTGNKKSMSDSVGRTKLFAGVHLLDSDEDAGRQGFPAAP